MFVPQREKNNIREMEAAADDNFPWPSLSALVPFQSKNNKTTTAARVLR